METAREMTTVHPSKPQTVFCRMGHLTEWTGWTRYQIDLFVELKMLKVLDRPGRRRLFYVESAQAIIDSGG